MPFSLPNNLQWLPGGRLTLTSATPVLSSAVTSATSIYYTPYIHNIVPIYDSTLGVFVPTIFSELTNVTTNNTTNPAACTLNSNYDLFVWSNAGTLTLSRGPAWTSDTARGTGAGTTQLTRVNGVWTNTVAITNGPGAGLGTYVGTVRTDGSSQVNWNPTPAAASGGANARVDIYNAYNRVIVSMQSSDSTASWTYSSTTWRSANNSTSNRLNYVDGLGELYVNAAYTCYGQGTGVVMTFSVGVNRDSTSATPTTIMAGAISSTAGGIGNIVQVKFLPSIGFHYLQAMEKTDGSSATFYSSGINQYLNAELYI